MCPTHRTSILLEFQGSVRRLLLHREASGVLADAFELYANAYERSLLLKDFYGKEANLFTVTTGSAEDKEKAKMGLTGLLQGAEKERRKRIMSAMQENLRAMSVFWFCEIPLCYLSLTDVLCVASTTQTRVLCLTP